MGKHTGLAKEQDRALGRLSRALGGARFYLAGGGAVAWHLGHRVSRDLDLFSRAGRVGMAALRGRILAALPSARVLAASDATLQLEVDGVAVDIVRYPYPPLEAPVPGPSGFPVAGLRDLAAMKLATIGGRGLRRDFWDVREILRVLAIEEAASAYLERFGLHEPDLYHLARALTYFADAEREPRLPVGLTPRAWAEIKRTMRVEAPKLLLQPPTSPRRPRR